MGQEDVDLLDLVGSVDTILAQEASSISGTNKQLIVRITIYENGNSTTTFIAKSNGLIKSNSVMLEATLKTYNKL